MKIAIVYYSMSGNNEYVAKYSSEKTDADIIKIEPKKEYPNIIYTTKKKFNSILQNEIVSYGEKKEDVR